MDDDFSQLLEQVRRVDQPTIDDRGSMTDFDLPQPKHLVSQSCQYFSSEPSDPTYQDAGPRYVSCAHLHRDEKPTSEPNTASSKIPLVSTNAVPDRARSIFNFKTFNAIQSKSFRSLYHGDDNFVLSAPTGSGKTVAFELAILRAIQTHPAGTFKVVYMAPIKALCSERSRDWKSKFPAFNLRVEEVTGDSDSASLTAVRDADIIVTTPEKWDSMTRKWKDHEKLVRMIRLLLIDEVHILGKDRGPTLEAVVSRMKSMESDIRFIALSATIPNCRDIATWLGRNSVNSNTPALCEEFGEEFRPVKLQRYILGYDSSANDFQLDAYLGKQLPDVVLKYSAGKPILVFCGTRKSCSTTAKLLAQWSEANRHRYWVTPRTRVTFEEESLTETSKHGVAFHHAGVGPQDRQKVEQMFINGELGVICCTSTLAVGVNLPCYLVIIKGTSGFENGAPCEMSELEILQMLGRAGRPQFDDEAVAVIMTRKSRELSLKRMIECTEVVESRLHLNLIEHLNAEIGLGTIRDIHEAVKWLSGTFLQVRLRANPDHYRKKECQLSTSLDRSTESICAEALDLLKCYDLICSEGDLKQTPAGAAMARYYISFETMKGVVTLEPRPRVSELLSTICASDEFRGIFLRSKEKSLFKSVNQAPSIRFPFKVDLAQGHQKVSLLIQSVLGGVDILTNDPGYKHQYGIDQQLVFQHARRLIRCIVDCQAAAGDSVGIRNSLMLVRSFGAQVWDDSPLALQQVATIGPVGARKLINANITSVDALISASPPRLESILSRQHPYGLKLIRYASELPRLRVSVSKQGLPYVRPKEGVVVNLKMEIGFINDQVPTKFAGQEVVVCFLAEISDGRKVEFGKVSANKIQLNLVKRFTASLTAPDQSIVCSVACEETAGTLQSASLDPKVSVSLFAGLDLPKAVPAKFDQVETPTQITTAMRRPSEDKAAQEPDWDDEALADADLAAAEDALPAVSNAEDHRQSVSATSKQPVKPKLPAKRSSPEPERLPNGNWKCNHSCKDRVRCSHKCCTNGLESKPRRKTKAKATKENQSTSDAKVPTAGDKRQTKLKPTTLSRLGSGKRDHNGVEVLDLSTVEERLSEPPAKKQKLSSMSYNVQGGKAHASVETGQDEFEGFDDLDDIPDLDSLLTQKSVVVQPPVGILKQREKDIQLPDLGQMNHDMDCRSEERAQSEEHWLEAVMIGAEDSLMLSSPERNNMELEHGTSRWTLPSYELVNTPDVTDTAVEAGTACGVPRTATEDDAAELEGLRTFLHELFGDLVELV